MFAHEAALNQRRRGLQSYHSYLEQHSAQSGNGRKPDLCSVALEVHLCGQVSLRGMRANVGLSGWPLCGEMNTMLED